MKKTIKLLPIAIILIGISISGCKKDKSSSTDTNSMQQLAKDDNQVQSTSDDVTNDVNDAVSPHLASKSTADWWLNTHCNVALDSVITTGSVDTLKFTYSGLNCKGTLNKNGSVYVLRAKGVHWKDAGALVSIIFNNLRVTKVSNGKTFTFSGSKTFTNISGGLLIQLGTAFNSIVHQVAGTLNIKFDDGTSRTWNVARQKTFTGTFDISTLTFSNLSLTVTGLGSSNGYTNLEAWGTNRNGEAFYSQITTGILFREDCAWRAVAGQLVHQIPSAPKSATISYGYDSSNNPTTIYANVSEYKLDWVKGSKSGTMFVQQTY